MTNTNQIRQLLQQTRDMLAGSGEHGFCYQKLYDWVAEALDLFPCKTCNDTGQVLYSLPHTCRGQTPGIRCNVCSEAKRPCPDCQSITMEQEEQQLHQQP